MNNNALLIIDPQNSFCNPGDASGNQRGALYVPGAEDDMARLSEWLVQNKQAIDYVAITLDWHQPNDISHPNFWEDANGQHPEPFTQITAAEVENGKWKARFEPERCLNYLKALEEQGEYPHVIWPVHCVKGTESAAIYQPLAGAVMKWTEDGKFYRTVTKGTVPFTEHFGAFQAQIPDAKHPETEFNQQLIDELSEYQTIYVAGQARSHCVANSLKQLLEQAPQLALRLVVLDDCMSDVPGFETIATPIYEKARRMNVKFTTTANEKPEA